MKTTTIRADFMWLALAAQAAYDRACAKHPYFKPTPKDALVPLGEEFGEICRVIEEEEGDDRLIEETMDEVAVGLRIVEHTAKGLWTGRAPEDGKPMRRMWMLVQPENLENLGTDPVYYLVEPAKELVDAFVTDGWRLVELRGR